MKAHHLSRLSVYHSDKSDDTYHVLEKAFPPDLLTKHAQYGGHPVDWITNFGFQHKASGVSMSGRLEESYDIELDPPKRPNAQLVYFDGTAVQTLPTRPSDTTPHKLKATLDLGDPPIGWTGR